jgi:hypothetical protein
MPKAKLVTLPIKIRFDDAMRRLVRLPPPRTGKKAKGAKHKRRR